MSEAMLDEFATFFDDMPDVVRTDLSRLLVTLADEEDAAFEDQSDYEWAARALFNAQTPAGRLGNLINAVGLFDVYFAVDASKRFELRQNGSRPHPSEPRGAAASGRYAGHLKAIDIARQQWAMLRRGPLSSAAIGEALLLPTPH